MAQQKMDRFDFWASLWIDSVVLILLSCCVASCFSQLVAGAWVGFAGACVLCAFRLARADRSLFQMRRPHGLEWGIALLVLLTLVSLLAGPHCFLDSYSYRFPQMLFWLQEGHPWSIPNVDMRINQMPHVWPMLSAAFYLPFGERGVAIPNFISFLLLAALFHRWAFAATGDRRSACAIALIFLSAPVFLMGASTNDNVVTCVGFLSLSCYFALDGKNPSRSRIAHSALAFALCCGIKPQYLILAPVWALWFFASSSSPWRCYRNLSDVCREGLLLLPVLVLCSPLPSLAVNQLRWGSFKAPLVVEKVSSQLRRDLEPLVSESQVPRHRDSPYRSFAALLFQLSDVPVNPLSGKLNRMLATALPNARLSYRPLLIAESASLGFFVFLPFAIGLCRVSFFHKQSGASLGNRFFPLLFLLPMSAATLIMKPGTLGRSFIGFFVPLFPIVMRGLCRGRFCEHERIFRMYALFCLLVGTFVVITDSSRPLWPVCAVARHIRSPVVKRQLEDYAHYSQRQYGPRRLLECVPHSEKTLGIIVQAGDPVAECWLGRDAPTRVVPYATNVTSERLDSDGVRYVIVKADSLLEKSSGSLQSKFLARLGCRIAFQSDYTTYMSRGNETWFLIARQ